MLNKKLIFLLLISLFLLGSYSWLIKTKLLNENRYGLSVNSEVPNVEISFIDGDTSAILNEISDYELTWIYFWASWCIPCRQEAPKMSDLYDQYNKEGLQILAINFKETPEKIENFMNEFSIPFNTILDPEAIISRQFEVSVLPTSYLVNSNGIILHSGVGVQPFWESEIKKYLEVSDE